MSDVSQIDGSAVRLSREAQGWAINDLAARACLSVKQVRQIEEGGLSSFYSESVKLTAARKVASLLHMSQAQLFGQVPLLAPQAEEESLLFAAPSEPERMTHPEPVSTSAYAGGPASGVHLSRSEPLHFLAQPPEDDGTTTTPAYAEASAAPLQPATVHLPSDNASTTAPASAPQALIEPVASGNYFLKILVLFLVAIAVAALLRPKPTESTDPSPSSPETATGQSMTAPVQPATGETAAPSSLATAQSPEATSPATDTKALNAAEPATAGGASATASTTAASPAAASGNKP